MSSLIASNPDADRIREVDIVANDRSGRPVLWVEVKTTAEPESDELQRLLGRLAMSLPNIPFGMLATLDHILVYRGGSDQLRGPILSLDANEILRVYDPEISSKRIFEAYLTSLVEAWLRDLAYHWKSQDPPASDEVASIGLLDRLADGTTRTGGRPGDHSVP